MRWTTLPFAAALLVLGSTLALASCKDDSGAPTLAGLQPQTIDVGQTLTIELFAADPDGDTLEFSFNAAVPELPNTTSLTPSADGSRASFSFTPIPSQVGTHIFDFTVSDGKHTATSSTAIEVRASAGAGKAPKFVRPFSQGTVLDLQETDCATFDVEVEDPDSPSVTLSQVVPVIEGSMLDRLDGLSARWRWCPTREQIEGTDQWDLTLSADDGDNPAAFKEFVIIVRKPSGEGCPGAFPNIDHAVADFSTVLDVELVATISDDMGLGSPPAVLYAFEDPGNPVQFELLNNVATMELSEGDMRSGTWRASIPNPVANEPEGSVATLWYIIQASDDDDPSGDCDHRTDAPPQGAYQVQITNSGGSGGAGLCAPCSADIQCGEASDLCVDDPSGSSFCARDCSSAGCSDPAYVCLDGVTSVDEATGSQCMPASGSCEGGNNGGDCEDDAAEDDDNPEQGAMLPPIDPDEYVGTLCPDDEDWWFFQLDAEAAITATLDGPKGPDLDLALTNESGNLIAQSIGGTSEESIVSACQPAGTYFLRVYEGISIDDGVDYDITLALDTEACMVSSGESCCEVHDSPGCNDPVIEMCVCEADPWCCGMDPSEIGTWDNTCITAIASEGCAPPCP